MIISNQIRCVHCGDEPWSGTRHDFRYCECKKVAVDGGMEYLRRIGNPNDYVDISIVLSDKEVKWLSDAIEDPTKNTLGKLCNIARVLRDDMNINIGE